MKIDIATATEKYGIIYTDPPWKQGRGGKKASRPNSTGGGVPYETLDIPGIMEIHRHVLTDLAADNHNVFMWTIDKYLPDAERIMEMLGYKLHARLVWDKGNGPAPAYTLRFSHEYLLWFFKKRENHPPGKGPARQVQHDPARAVPAQAFTEAGMRIHNDRVIIPRRKEAGAVRKERTARLGLLG